MTRQFGSVCENGCAGPGLQICSPAVVVAGGHSATHSVTTLQLSPVSWHAVPAGQHV